MSKKKNIEDLFRQEFQNFEAPVDPAIWSNIQAGMAANASVAAGGISLVKAIIIGAVAAGLIAGGIFIATNNSESSKEKDQQTTKEIASVEDKTLDNELVEELDSDKQIESNENIQNKESKEDLVDNEGAKDTESNEKHNSDKTQNDDETNGSLMSHGQNEDKRQTPGPKDQIKETKDQASDDKADELNFKLYGSDITGIAPVEARFNVVSNTEDITWSVKNSEGDLINVIVGKDFEMNFEKPGSYLVQVKSELNGQIKQGEILVEVKDVIAEHTEKFGFEVDQSILDLKQEAVVLDMNNPLRSALKFKLTTEQVEVFKLSIFDGNTRQLVFETTNIDERNWAGKDMDGNQVQGTYYFMEAVAGNGNNALEIIRKRVDIISNK